ncbi:hypothetical protein FRX31_034253, partial [Thalictrum thalictroides]
MGDQGIPSISSSPKPNQPTPTPLAVANPVQEEVTKENEQPESSKSTKATKRWSSLLRTPPPSAGKEELNFINPVFEDGKLVLDDEILEEGAREWENRVVGFFLDKKLPYSMVKEILTRRWKLQGEFDIGLDEDMFYFHFNNEEDREYVLDEGPVLLAGKLFVVRAWTREVEENRGSICSVPIWLKMYNVPKHLWNAK